MVEDTRAAHLLGAHCRVAACVDPGGYAKCRLGLNGSLICRTSGNSTMKW